MKDYLAKLREIRDKKMETLCKNCGSETGRINSGACPICGELK